VRKNKALSSERVAVKGFSNLVLGLETLIYATSQIGFEWIIMRLMSFGIALFGSSLFRNVNGE